MASAQTTTPRDHTTRVSEQETSSAEASNRTETRQAPLLRPAVFNPSLKPNETSTRVQTLGEGGIEVSLPAKSQDTRYDDTQTEQRADTPVKKKKRKRRQQKDLKEERESEVADVENAVSSSTRTSAFSVVGGAPQPVLPTIPPRIPLIPAGAFARAPLLTAPTRLVMSSAVRPPIFSIAANPQLAPAMQPSYLPGLPLGAYAPGLTHPAAAALLRLPYAAFPIATLSEAAIRAAAAAVVTSGVVSGLMPSLNLPSAKIEQQIDSGFFSDHSSTSTPTAATANAQNPLQRSPVSVAGESGRRKGKRKAEDVEQEDSDTSATSPKLLIDSAPGTPVEASQSTSACNKKHITEEEQQAAAATDQSQGGMTDSAKALLFCATECHLAVLQDDEGDTPLHLAIAQGNLPLTSYLVALLSGAKMNLDIFNYIKQTPLHLAVITRQPAVVVMLVKGSANANLPDRNGRTAVHLAVEAQDIGCLQALTHANNPKLNLEIRNFEGFTALHVAVLKGSLAITQYLLSLCADINAADGKSGMTPLHHAVECKNIEMIQLLIKRGASVHSTTFGGGTALHLASGYAFIAAIKLLLASGANSRASNVEGDTPADVAPNSGLSQMLRSGDRRKGTT